MTELNLAKTTQNRVIVKVASFTCGITTAQEKKTCFPVRVVPEVIGLNPTHVTTGGGLMTQLIQQPGQSE